MDCGAPATRPATRLRRTVAFRLVRDPGPAHLDTLDELLAPHGGWRDREAGLQTRWDAWHAKA
eukprot:9119820-Alexandrium_andersonii.AAC.1